MKILSMLTAICMLAYLSSCSDDEPTIDIDDDAVIVSDGFYVVGGSAPSETPAASGILSAGLVEGAGFASMTRTGYYETYLYLDAGGGGLQIAEYSNNEETLWGATTTTVTQESDGDISFDYLEGTLTDGGAMITPIQSGLHHVVVDLQTTTILVVPILEWNIAGTARDGQSFTFKDVSADGLTYSGSVVLRGGSWKLRYNDSWKIDKRIDNTMDGSDTNGFVAFSNFGGTVDNLEQGAGNLDELASGTGTYDFSLAFTNASTTPVLTTNRTGDAPAATFVIADNMWGIKGSGSKNGWGTVTTFFDSHDGSTHTYVNVLYLTAMADGAAAEFGFGIEGKDDFKGYNAVSVTDNSGNIVEAGGGNFQINADGFYTMILKSEDDGENWSATFNATSFGIIGDGVGGWDADKFEMTAASDSTFTSSDVAIVSATDWKFRADDAWDFGVGGPLDNMVVNSFDNCQLADGGTYKVTLTLHASGRKFSAAVE